MSALLPKKFKIDLLIEKRETFDGVSKSDQLEDLQNLLGIGKSRLRTIRSARVGDVIRLHSDALLEIADYFNVEMSDILNVNTTDGVEA